jgi:hypothetical protein
VYKLASASTFTLVVIPSQNTGTGTPPYGPVDSKVFNAVATPTVSIVGFIPPIAAFNTIALLKANSPQFLDESLEFGPNILPIYLAAIHASLLAIEPAMVVRIVAASTAAIAGMNALAAVVWQL